MIEAILPSSVRAVEARTLATSNVLFPEEEASLGRPVEKRRRQFTTGRACAHAAFERLGLAPMAVTSGPRGEPQWPPGIVGSITHTDEYWAAAVARSSEMMTVSIDAKPNAPLPRDVLATISLPEERRWISGRAIEMGGVHLDRLLFSAKEAGL